MHLMAHNLLKRLAIKLMLLCSSLIIQQAAAKVVFFFYLSQQVLRRTRTWWPFSGARARVRFPFARGAGNGAEV